MNATRTTRHARSVGAVAGPAPQRARYVLQVGLLSALLLGACGGGEPPSTVTLAFFATPDLGPIEQVHLFVEADGRRLVENHAIPSVPEPSGVADGETFVLLLSEPPPARVSVRVESRNGDRVLGYAALEVSPIRGDDLYAILKLESAFCGDGRVLGDEVCDPGIDANCDADCRPGPTAVSYPEIEVEPRPLIVEPVRGCGDGVVDFSEICEPVEMERFESCLAAGYFPPALGEPGRLSCLDCRELAGCGPPIGRYDQILEAIELVTQIAELQVRGPEGRVRIGLLPGAYEGRGGSLVIPPCQARGAASSDAVDDPPGAVPAPPEPDGCDGIGLYAVDRGVILRNVGVAVDGPGHAVEGLNIVTADESLLFGVQVHARATDAMIRGNDITLHPGQTQFGVVSGAARTTVLGNRVRRDGGTGQSGGIFVSGAGAVVAQNVVSGALGTGIRVLTVGAESRVDHNTVATTRVGAALHVDGPTCMRQNLLGSTVAESAAIRIGDTWEPGECLVPSLGVELAARGNLLLGDGAFCETPGGRIRCEDFCADTERYGCAPLRGTPVDPRNNLCPDPGAQGGADVVDAGVFLGYDMNHRQAGLRCIDDCFSGAAPDIGAREYDSPTTFALDPLTACR